MNGRVKKEFLEHTSIPNAVSRVTPKLLSRPPPGVDTVIDLSSSSDEESDYSDHDGQRVRVSALSKKRKLNDSGVSMPLGFLAPLPHTTTTALNRLPVRSEDHAAPLVDVKGCKQFWKAGDYDVVPSGDWGVMPGGMDHVRVHPKFLHSNATSHTWALGAFAELLDNSLDEVSNGATLVKVDVLTCKKDGSRMLLVEDNGGGMDLNNMRHCMSLGYSAKSKMANKIGQYGNGFKTSTMRLGADVIVFSRTRAKDGKSPTQCIGLLSYTFLRSTGKEDIVLPMLDYERKDGEWKKMTRSSSVNWSRTVDTIVQWSPFNSESDLLRQFDSMKDQGTRIFIYNLWEDNEGSLELDFDTDPEDIQLGGVNRDEKNIQMAKEYPNSRHFLTYKHSLRSYASILYLRLPPRFRIIIRGKDVHHHNIVNDMMMSQDITYRPMHNADGVPKDSNMTATVTIGFVKDAKFHIDVQGFNVYHKNRLIKPFWRIWNPAGSDGRGVIGVLEANFVEPAHDKQGFERTTVLARLEARLIQMQKNYWCTYCHEIGYAARRNKKLINENLEEETSPNIHSDANGSKKKQNVASSSKKKPALASGKPSLHVSQKSGKAGRERGNVCTKSKENTINTLAIYRKRASSSEPPSPGDENDSDDHVCSPSPSERQTNGFLHATKSSPYDKNSGFPNGYASEERVRPDTRTKLKDSSSRVEVSPPTVDSNLRTIELLKQENLELRERLEKYQVEMTGEMPREFSQEGDKETSLEKQLEEARNKIEELNKEYESLIDVFSEERERRNKVEETLRSQLKDAYNKMDGLLDKIKMLERKSD